ncbi:hypothetical protein [Enterococcus sp. AZ109]|uniref:hypothetical protein n=1 Tax=Enterococcus sp. AZ109 TaxID=2774634 RepID=UPI003F1EC593
MKKKYLFVLVAAVCVGLSACTKENTSNESSGNSTYSSKSEIVTEESASVTSTSTVSSSSSKEEENLTVPESTASLEEIPVEQQLEPVQPKTEEEIKAEIISRYAARSGMPAEKLFVVVISSDDNGYDLQLRESGTTAPSGSAALALLYYDKHTSILYEDVVGKMEVASF